MGVARPVRLARPSGASFAGRPADAGAASRPGGTSSGGERRENRGASRRAVRISVLYALGIAAVFTVLSAVARAGPAGGSSGTSTDLWAVGLVALAVGAVGVVVALGAAPRAVELGLAETVVIGRFGHRYVFPGTARLRPVVLQRFPAGLLSPVAVESVEIGGGTSRRAFLLDERLLDTAGETAEAPDALGR